MLYQLNYEANVWLVSFIQSRQSLVHAISTELWSKCLTQLSPTSNQDSLWYMLYQLNYEANVCLVSFIQSKQSVVNVLSTQLWIKCLPCLLPPINKVSGECYINWTMKQMPALSPSSHQDNLWWMLYQLNNEANVCLVSFTQSRPYLVHALSTELRSKCLHYLLRPIKTVSGICSINWTMKRMYALSPSSNQNSLWWMFYHLNYESNVCLISFL